MAVKCTVIKSLLLFLNFLAFLDYVRCTMSYMLDEDVLSPKAFVFWPNATIPFFIDPEHFDQEQSLAIMTAFSVFAFKTCLKFAPVMAPPGSTDHVLVLENPTGVRKCFINTEPHSIEEPHRVILGYDCLKSPEIDMMIMKALGFHFEHNRAVRDLYIDVQQENVEPGFLELFTKDVKKPIDFNQIPYDINSVMHFGERDFSKNGHKTIIFKNITARQERYGLSPLDLRKIDVVYGPECHKRDRQEKIELCQNYPGVARKKRDVLLPLKSLRVNPDITPPPSIVQNYTVARSVDYTEALIQDLGIENEIESIIELVYKTSSVALTKARSKVCNGSKEILRTITDETEKPKNKNVIDIIGAVTGYAQDVVKLAIKNVTQFCLDSTSIHDYQRASCPFFQKSRCQKSYRSTKNGPVRFSTKHRPFIRQSTKHWDRLNNNNARFVNMRAKDDNAENSSVTPKVKKEESTVSASVTPDLKSRPALRSATNKILRETKDVFAPAYYRASSVNELTTNGRRKREVTKNYEETIVSVKITTPKEKKALKKLEKAEKLAKRRFESQRFRSKRTETRKGEYERGLKERLWDNSGVTMERVSPHRSRVLQGPRAGLKPPKLKVKHKNGAKDSEPSGEQIRFDKKSRDVNVAEEELDETPTEKNVFSFEMDPSQIINNKSIKPMAEMEVGDLEPEIPMDNMDYIAPEATERPLTDKTDKAHKVRPKKKLARKPITTTEHQLEVVSEEVEPEKGPEDTGKKKSGTRLRQKKRLESAGLSTLPRVVELAKKNREFYEERKWPDGVVRYVISDPGEIDIEDVRHRLSEVNDILTRRTCVRIEELAEEEADNYEDYLVLDSSPDYVTGRVGGKQNFGVLELLKGGQHRQHTAMMVMAMLGFYFEVSRHDRDKYIRVHMRHVRPDKLHHFEKIREDATFPLPYDYKSATHPAWQFWRQIGKTGISTVATYKEADPDGSIMKSLGQNRQLLSELDLVKINSVYGIDCFVKKSKSKHLSELAAKEPEVEEEEVNKDDVKVVEYE